MFTIGILAVAIVRPQAPVRANAAYWFPAAEGVEKWLPRLVDEELFDTWVVDPKPNPLTLETAKSKVKIVAPGAVYSKPNDRWREVTIKFVQGKVSPAAWLKETSKLGETYHYLTTPKTPSLRSLTANLPNGLGAYSGRAVFAETLLCYWSGKPCFYSTDVWRTSYFPEDKQHESWILAMNDFLGPMLRLRAENSSWTSNKPTVLRADTKPGLFVFQRSSRKQTFSFYFNNGLEPKSLPKGFKPELAIMPRGLDVESKGGPYLLGSGTVLIIDPPE